MGGFHFLFLIGVEVKFFGMQFLKMQDLPTASLQDQSSSSGFRDRDVSPDSVIFTADSNFSLFSSTSASVDRCSFASDIHDQEDSVVSDISQVWILCMIYVLR